MPETVTIKAQYLSKIDFKAYGQTLDPGDIDKIVEPVKGVLVTPNVGQIEIEKGELVMNYLKVLQRPLIVDALERHVYTTQTVIPLMGCCGLYLVAPPSEDPENKSSLPDLNKVIAVIFDGSEGLNIKKGAWHSAPFALSEESHYIMVMRKGTLDGDLQMVDLKKEMNKYFEIVL